MQRFTREVCPQSNLTPPNQQMRSVHTLCINEGAMQWHSQATDDARYVIYAHPGCGIQGLPRFLAAL